MAEVDWETRIRESVEAFNRGDFAAVLAYASDDVELRRVQDSPDRRDVIRGREQVAEFLRPDVWADQTSEVIEVVRGDGAFIAKVRFKARGAGSGLALELESYIVWKVTADLVTRVEFHTDPAEAQAAAGLDPA